MNAATDARGWPEPIRRLSRRGFLGGSLGIAALALAACRDAEIVEVPPAPVAAFPGLGSPPLLVDAAWLRARQDDPTQGTTLVLDLSDLPTFRAGHIPGAVHAWWQDWIDPYSDIYGVLLGTRNVLTARTDLLASLGIDDSVTVVAYDADRNRYAARLVWILRYLGLPNASVLDGGLGAWLGSDGERSTAGGDPPAAQPITLSPASRWTIPFEEMRDRYADPAIIVLDVRTDDEAEDDLNGLLREGQIPGSIRLPWTATLRDDAGRLLPPDALAALFAAAGVTRDREVVVVARFGVETAQTWLVLSLLGYPNVRVFDRGWAHWGRKDLDMPVVPLSVPR